MGSSGVTEGLVPQPGPVLPERLAWLVPEMVGKVEVVAAVLADLVQVALVARPLVALEQADALS
tara:strand:- start:2228 stop:2419 length:192 start_codon:yes stop_codon:yes gene_type:complete